MSLNLTRIQYNGLTIEPGGAYTINNSGGLTGRPIRTERQDRTGEHGGNIFNQLYGMREIFFEGNILCKTPEEFFTALNALVKAFSINENNESLPLTIRLWDGSEKTIDAFVSLQPQVNFKGGRTTTAPFRVELIAEDGAFRSLTPVLDPATGNLPQIKLGKVGGSPVPTPVPFPVGSGGSTGEIILVNSGSESAFAKFTINGAVINPRITNKTTGKFIEVQTTLLFGESLTIEMKSTGESVTKGSADYYEFVDGEIFKIAPGSNILSFTANQYSETALLTVEFYNRYLTITG